MATVYTRERLTEEARRAVKGKGRYVGWRLEIGEPLNGSVVVLVVEYVGKSDIKDGPVQGFVYVAI